MKAVAKENRGGSEVLNLISSKLEFEAGGPMQGSLLDSEGFARGTTVYLVDERLDMLPGLLSEHLCSLRQQQDRLAVSVIWTLGPQLDVEDVWFGRSVIR